MLPKLTCVSKFRVGPSSESVNLNDEVAAWEHLMSIAKHSQGRFSGMHPNWLLPHFSTDVTDFLTGK